ncbi:MAG: hypothetical protein IKE75_03200 [Bacilli bacterium]|nr:hypothetical protein [Bacilli bacterium]
MKKLSILTIILVVLLVICYTYRTEIVTFVMKNAVQNKKIEAPNDNNYTTNYEFAFVKTTDHFHVTDRQNILNVIYTVLNSGANNFKFYCDTSYENCKNDLKNISEDQALLSTINNMVSPYNSYKKLYITINTYGEANINIDKLYDKNDKEILNNKINDIKNEIIKDNMSNKEKIKVFHDYLINHTTYDEERAKMIESGTDTTPKYNSHKANGPLLEGYALCSGYSDAMKLYLDELGIPNYKISNDKHIWNLVYIDNKWLHIDLTWDDPITNDGGSLLLDNFFLITTDELLKLDVSNHGYNIDYYPELK